MKNRTTTQIASLAVVASLLGFSSAGFAQSEAVDALNARDAQNDTAAVEAESHPMADALAADLDAFNTQDEGYAPETHVPANAEQQQVAQQTRELAAEIDAYNASATEGRIPSTHIPADEMHQPNRGDAQELAAELTRYNQSGGSLNSVRF